MEYQPKNYTPEKKLLLSLNLYYSAMKLKKASLKKLYPELSEKEIQQKVKQIFSNART
jgi:hypothetical protein